MAKEPLYSPCWRCGHQYPRDATRCPGCHTRRKLRAIIGLVGKRILNPHP